MFSLPLISEALRKGSRTMHGNKSGNGWRNKLTINRQALTKTANSVQGNFRQSSHFKKAKTIRWMRSVSTAVACTNPPQLLTWINTFWYDAAALPINVGTYQDCLNNCLRDSACAGFDFEYTVSPFSCWKHPPSIFTSDNNRYGSDSSIQLINATQIIARCSTGTSSSSTGKTILPLLPFSPKHYAVIFIFAWAHGCSCGHARKWIYFKRC